MRQEERSPGRDEAEALAEAFSVLAAPTRLRLLDRLRAPAFAPDLADELGVSRQAVAKHLEVLQEAGLVEARPAKRGFLPALEYHASPAGLFAFKEAVLQLARPEPAREEGGTILARSEAGAPPPPAPGLLVVHGRQRGEWLLLPGGPSWAIGRDAINEVVLGWDPFASARHALLARDGSEWTVTDLAARNGTLLNFAPLPPGRPVRVRHGDLLVVGRTVLSLRC
ncbi:MAG TPA: helix-turn-helix domain-containing protein [Candidatus Thermoplasmatota archaeon]|nr:helix-turn-helix domain-containing protein [Candidatus Thermoplasmatota archaeon]